MTQGWVNDPVYADLRVRAKGGLYNEYVGIPNATWDLTKLLVSVRLTESVNEAARRCELTFDNQDNKKLLAIQSGTRFALYGRRMSHYTGKPTKRLKLYYGQSFSDARSSSEDSKTRTYTTYDMLTFLTRNEDTLVFNDRTATEILYAIAARYSIPLSTVVDTEVPVGQIIMGPGMTLWDAISEALQRTARKVGLRYYIRCVVESGTHAIQLLKMGESGVTYKIHDGTGGTLESLDFTDSAEELRTKLSIVGESEDGGSRFTTFAERADTGYGKRTFGVLHKIEAPDFADVSPDAAGYDHPDQTRLDEQLTATWRMVNRGVLTATTKGLLIPGIRRGDRIQLTSKQGGFNPRSTFYVSTVVSEYAEEGLRQTLDLVFNPLDA